MNREKAAEKKKEKIFKELKKAKAEGNTRREQTLQVVKRNIEDYEKSYIDTALGDYKAHLKDLADKNSKQR